MDSAGYPPSAPINRGATDAHSDTDPPDTDASDATSGQDTAPGTMRMARRLLDPATKAEIQALAAEAGPMTEDQRATLARLLRLRPNHRQR